MRFDCWVEQLRASGRAIPLDSPDYTAHRPSALHNYAIEKGFPLAIVDQVLVGRRMYREPSDASYWQGDERRQGKMLAEWGCP